MQYPIKCVLILSLSFYSCAYMLHIGIPFTVYIYIYRTRMRDVLDLFSEIWFRILLMCFGDFCCDVLVPTPSCDLSCI